MESLRTTLEQFKQRFNQLSPTARMGAAGLAALVLVGLLFFLRSSTRPQREYLFGGREFSQSDLAAMEQAFGQAGLNEWRVDGYRIEVPSEAKSAYVAAIAESKAVLLEFENAIDAAHDQSGIFESAEVRRQRLQSARQRKIAMVVKRLPGIKDAAVEYSESETQTFPRRTERRALVAVQAVGQRHLALAEVDAIRQAIVSTQGGLDAADVAVLDINATHTYLASDPGYEAAPGAGSYAMHKQMYETLWKEKIRQRLINYPGLVVEVNVEMAAAASPALAARAAEPTSPAAAGMTAPAHPSGPATQMGELVPNTVAVSIGVPSTYYEAVWRKHHTTSAGSPKVRPRREDLARIESATLAKVEEIVTALVRQIPLANDNAADVTVRTDEVLPLELPEVHTIGERLAEWLVKNWQTVALVSGGFLVLIYLRRSLRTAKAPTSPQTDSLDSRTTQRPSVAHYGVDAELSVDSRDPEELQEELAELIREDPNAAAEALKKFLGKVA